MNITSACYNSRGSLEESSISDPATRRAAALISLFRLATPPQAQFTCS